MIYVTGDTHRDLDFDKLKVFQRSVKGLTRGDYVIIAGDFGAVWSKKTLEKDLTPYKALPFTVLFVDGNHENFALLNGYPTINLFGGKVHKIADNIVHLMRGQVFSIDGLTVFAFGGAESHPYDKAWRLESGGNRVSWWEEESPTYADFAEARKNLSAVGNKVDVIVTHTVDERGLYMLPAAHRHGGVQPTNAMLTEFEETVSYGHWYFGHHHLDAELTDKKNGCLPKSHTD